MARYTRSEVKIEGAYPVLELLELTMDIGVNRHGTLTYGGYVAEENAAYYIHQSAERQLVNVFLNDELEFCGYPQEISVDCQNENCYLRVTLVTSSQFMDIDLYDRFFQKTDCTFANILNEAYEDAKTGNLVAVRGHEIIAAPILQYRETDWQFTLRMAGKIGTVVIPNVTLAEPQIMFGIPKRQIIDETNSIVYSIGSNSAEYMRKSATIDGMGYQKFLSYKMESENRYRLGDNVSIDGKILTVVQKNFVYERGEIQETYVLSSEAEYAVPFHHNKKIPGLELEGRVIERLGQQLLTVLDIDAQRNNSANTWFSYAPATNNGMYSMPLENEKITLQWQSETDGDILAVQPVRKNSHDMYDHRQRHFLTEHENHLLMIANKVEYTNPVGSMKWLAGIGFEISTNKDISLFAQGNININSQAQVAVWSPERITASKANVSSSIDMISSEIHLATTDLKVTSQTNKSKTARLPENPPGFTIDDTVKKIVAAVPVISNAGK